MASFDRHEELEHTGELRLRLSAASREGLFVEAARALASVMAGDVDAGLPGLPGEERSALVDIDARDLAGLLVEFINEIVFFAETHGAVVTSCAIEALTDTRLRARIAGRPPREWKTAVKAATYHDLTVEWTGDELVATVVLDV